MSSLIRLLSTLVTRPASTVLDAPSALVALPRRVVTMVLKVEQTLSAVNSATARTDALIDRINGIASKAEDAVLAAYQTVSAAAAAIDQGQHHDGDPRAAAAPGAGGTPAGGDDRHAGSRVHDNDRYVSG